MFVVAVTSGGRATFSASLLASVEGFGDLFGQLLGSVSRSSNGVVGNDDPDEDHHSRQTESDHVELAIAGGLDGVRLLLSGRGSPRPLGSRARRCLLNVGSRMGLLNLKSNSIDHYVVGNRNNPKPNDSCNNIKTIKKTFTFKLGCNVLDGLDIVDL